VTFALDLQGNSFGVFLPLFQQIFGMGRLSKERGSQKTCLNRRILPIRGRMGGLLDLEDKKGKSPGRIFRSGDFFARKPRQKRDMAFILRVEKEVSYFGYWR
jgi:hypothetical protein